jgi:hypothetical protein
MVLSSQLIWLDTSICRAGGFSSLSTNVIAPLPNGRFDQDECRVRYLRWLRDHERRSQRSQADADFIKAKTELIALRVREKKSVS